MLTSKLRIGIYESKFDLLEGVQFEDDGKTFRGKIFEIGYLGSKLSPGTFVYKILTEDDKWLTGVPEHVLNKV